MVSGWSWPGRDSAGIKLLAEFRTFSRVRERLGYSNWMTTSTGRLWPTADGRHPAPTGCFASSSGRSSEKIEMRSRMTAYG